MKKTILFMALAMMFAVVQGYAQRSVASSRTASRSTATAVRTSPSTSRSTATAVRTSPSTSRSTSTAVRTSSSTSRSTSTAVRTSSSTSRSTATAVRTSSSTSRSTATTARSPQSRHSTHSKPHHSGHPAPPPHDHHHHGGVHHRPHFNQAHHFHHHHCVFSAWAWVTFLDYQYRFVRHAQYSDRFFDTTLGYYVYGSLDKPRRIDVGNLSFIHRNGYLEIWNHNQITTYPYREMPNSLVYYVNQYTTVEVSFYYGFATVKIFDDYGNTAYYYI